MKSHLYFRSRNGFTLIELLVVISIIMVLAAMGFGVITKVNKKKDMLATQSHVTDLSLALQQYIRDYNKLPDVGSEDSESAQARRSHPPAKSDHLELRFRRESRG